MSVGKYIKDGVVEAEKKVTGQVSSKLSPTEEIDRFVKDPSLVGKSYADNFATNNISNAYHTSVLDPLDKGKKKVEDIWKKAEDLFNKGYEGLGVGGPGSGGGGNPFMVGRPGAGGPGGAPMGSAPSWAMGKMPGMAGAGAADPFRQGQMQLMQQLQNQAAGTGPSIAGNQMQQGQEAALAQNIAMANSARGGANPLMARQALQTNAMQGGKMAADMSNLRLQEQMQAQQMLGGIAGQGRQGDLGQNQLAVDAQYKQAGIQQAYADLQAKYAAMGLDADKANQAAMIEMQKLSSNDALGWADLGLQSQMAQNGMMGDLMQGAGGALAGIATMFSDKRLKKDVKKADSEISAFLSAIKPASYSYKDEKHGKGRFVSPMAQDLLKTNIGRSFVEEKPEGLAVNYGAGLGAILAAQATLHKRIEKLESK